MDPKAQTPNPEGNGTQDPTPTPGTGTPGAGEHNAPAGGKAPQNPQEDYEKKFGESTKENQRLMEIMKAKGLDPKTGEPLAPQAPRQPAPNTPSFAGAEPRTFTDEDLSKAIPGFAALSEDEKHIIRNVKDVAGQLSSLKAFVAEIADERQFAKDLKEARKNPELAEALKDEEAFKAFAYEDENLKLPFNVVVERWQYKQLRDAKGGTPAPQPNTPGMEGGTGGAKEIIGSEGKIEMTAEEAADFRKRDPRGYMRAVKEKRFSLK